MSASTSAFYARIAELRDVVAKHLHLEVPAAAAAGIVDEADDAAIARALVGSALRALGTDEAVAARITPGLAIVAIARAARVPDERLDDDVLRLDRERGRPIHLAPVLTGATATPTDADSRGVASFVLYSIGALGAKRFRLFLSELGKAEDAAMSAFGVPLAEIESRWREEIATPKARGLLTFVGRLMAALRPYAGSCVLVVVGLVLDIAFGAVSAMSFTWLVDKAIIPRGHALLFGILGGLGGGIVVVSLAAVGQDYLYAKLGANVASDLRHELFTHLQKLSIGYYARTPHGDLVFRFSGDLGAIEGAVAGAMPALLRAVLSFTVCLALLFFLEWRLALLSSLLLPLCLLGARVLARRASAANDDRKREEARAATAVQEALGAQAVIKAFGLERRIVDKFIETTGRVVTTTLRASFLGSLMTRTSAIAINVLELTVLAMGAYFAFYDWISIGTLLSFHALYLQVSLALLAIAQILPPMLNGMASMRRLDEVLSEPPKVIDAPDAARAPRLGREIAFEDVRFSYSGEKNDLDGLAFTIPAGQSVAFVGPSGSGKSTVVNLLMRFYEADGGRVMFDGTDIRAISQSSLREQIGIVMQESVLFNTTIRENIRLGRPEASDADVERASRAAEIHELIARMPHGYDTLVGERGGRLSGGQRQRVAIARAILRDPAVLILDEATSALDAGTEAAINATLQQVAAGRTVVSITHRLHSVTRVDRIFVLDRGRVVERGSHEELLATDGVYKRLWTSQSGFVFSDDASDVKITPARLRAIPLFGEFDDAALEGLSRRFATERHAAGATVFYDGDPGDKFFVIVRGEAVALKALDGGGEKRLAVMRDGDTFGEIALLRESTRTATVRAETACLFLTLQREHFFKLLDSNRGLHEKMVAVAAERLKRG